MNPQDCKIPFSPPYVDQDIIDEVISTLTSGWITSGPKVNEFEREICKYTNSQRTLCVNSWTSGAILILRWFGVEPGDEVIIPAYTYCATALAVMQCGAVPVMVDVGKDFTIDLEKLEKAITPKTKVIIPVDFAGLPCHYDEINTLVKREDIQKLFQPNSKNQQTLGRILIVSDAAHSLGATYKRQNVGSLTDITIFSFHAVKNITTAEGGAICFNLPETFDIEKEYELIRINTLNGQTKDAYSKTQNSNWKYDVISPGMKINMPDLCAAVGLAQLRKYNNQLLKKRSKIALLYQEFFSASNYYDPPLIVDHYRSSSFHIYPLRFKNCDETQRDLIIQALNNTGISVNVHFIPLPCLSLFKTLGYNIKDYPVTFDNYSREISLPIYPQLTEKNVFRITKTIHKMLKNFLS